MAIEEKQVTEEQKATEAKTVQDAKSKITDEVFASLELPTEEKKEEKTEEPEETEDVSEEPSDEEPAEESEESDEEPSEEVSEEPGDEEPEESDEESDEDLIPKSKVQKRFDDLTAQIKQLKADLKAKSEKSEKEEAEKPKSEDEKLEDMSMDQLRELKRALRLELMKETDEGRLGKLSDLEDKVLDKISTFNQRTEQRQVARFKVAVKETLDELGKDDFEKIAKDVYAIAQRIYKNSDTLKNSLNGQAEAWRLAVDQFSLLKKSSAGKESNKTLKREVNNLKKKTSLGSSVLKGSKEGNRISALKQRAVHGDAVDKTEYVKAAINLDDLIPDQFRR